MVFKEDMHSHPTNKQMIIKSHGTDYRGVTQGLHYGSDLALARPQNVSHFRP